jgi:hypothetical protein
VACYRENFTRDFGSVREDDKEAEGRRLDTRSGLAEFELYVSFLHS